MSLAELTYITELRLAVRAAPGETLRIAFRKVPGLAAAELGGVAVDWGDGFVERPALALSRAELEAAVRGAPPPYEALEHKAAAGRGLVTVRAPAGRLPALQLPWQTEAILSPLPQIVDGTVDAALRLAPARTLPALFASDATSPYLTELPADLLKGNPQLERFDATFAGCALRTLPAGLFSPCERIASLERTFAACALCSLPDGLLAAADARTLCRETFSDCRLLAGAGRIFAPSRVPAHLEGFMRGCPPAAFGCLRRIDREAAGLPYAPPTTASPCFEFLWAVRDSSPREVLRFYPCERKLQGGLLIEWGDGSGQYVDFQGADAVEHAFPSERCKGSSRVRLHYTDGFEVRPFKTGAFTSAYLTPLPPWAGRDEGNAGDYCGWAAGLRLLKHVPEGFFARNPGIRNLEQAFAGCTALRTAPDDIVEGLAPDLKADGMFAFCNALPRLPASFKALRRDASLDFFAGKEDDRA